MCLNTHSTKLIHLCLPMWLCRSDEPSGRSLLCLDSGDVLGTCPRWWWGMWTQARLVGVDPLLQASAQQADSVHLLRSLTDARYTMTEWCCGLGTRQFCVTQGCHFFSGKSGNLGQVGGVLRWLERSVSRESRKGLLLMQLFWLFRESYSYKYNFFAMKFVFCFLCFEAENFLGNFSVWEVATVVTRCANKELLSVPCRWQWLIILFCTMYCSVL